jgi:hypothetical protein
MAKRPAGKTIKKLVTKKTTARSGTEQKPEDPVHHGPALTADDVIRHLRHRIDDCRRMTESGWHTPTDHIEKLMAAGVFLTAATPLRSDPVVAAHFRRRRPKPKDCFGNCLRFVLAEGDSHAAYHEGYAVCVFGGNYYGVHHAWLVAGGKVIDPTLDGRDVVAYFGIPFGLREVASRARTERGLPMLDTLPTLL